MHQTLFPYQSGTFDKYCRRMGFSRGPVRQENRYNNRVTEGSDWNGANPRRFWTVDDHWSRVIFSDESMNKVKDNYRVYVWKRKGEGYRLDLYGRKKTIHSNHVSKLWYGGALPGTVSERFLLWTAISMQRNTWIHS